MKRTLYGIFLGLIFFMTTLLSATEFDTITYQNRFFRISLGGLHYQTKEMLLAPLRWDGAGSLLSLTYSPSSVHLLNEINFSFPLAFLSNRYDYAGYCFEVNFEYERLYLTDISLWGGSLFLGAKLGWNATGQYYSDWDDSHLYWLNAYSISPSARWNCAIKQDQFLSVGLALPLFSIISRPAEFRYNDQDELKSFAFYLTVMNENLEFATLNKYLVFNFNVEYSWQISDGTQIGVSWLFRYKNFTLPKSISLISNTILFNYNIIL